MPALLLTIAIVTAIATTPADIYGLRPLPTPAQAQAHLDHLSAPPVDGVIVAKMICSILPAADDC